MRIDQLEALVVVSRCQSLSAASEQLHISVQALSASVKSLENEMQMTLLERNSKGVTLTADGLAVVDMAKRFLAELYRIQSKHEDPRILALGQPIDIYTHSILYELFVPRLICSLRQQMPGIEIHVTKEAQREPLMEAVLSGRAEFAFAFYTAMNRPGYRYHPELTFNPLFECKLVCLAHRDFPFTSLKSVSLKKLLPYPILIYRSPKHRENDLLQLLEYFGAYKSIIFEEDYLIYREMVESGFGISFSLLTPFESYHRPYSEKVSMSLINEDIQLLGGYIHQKAAHLTEASDIFLRYCRNFLLRTGKAYPYCVY